MVFRPFRLSAQACLPFIVFDGDFDLPEDLLAVLTDRCSQCRHGVGGVEVKDTQEVLMGEDTLRINSAPGQERV